MAQSYWNVWGAGLSCWRGAEATAGPTAISRLGLAGLTLLLVVTGWLAPARAAQVTLTWDATATYTDGTPVTALVGYYLSLQDSAGGTQRVDVGNQTTYTLTGLAGGLIYTITVTATDTMDQESRPSNAIIIPVPLAPPETTTLVGTAAVISVLAADTDPTGAPLTITAVTQGAHGRVTITGTRVTYTPETGFVGTDSFTYTVIAGPGTATTASVTVNVLPRTQPSLAVADYSVLVGYADLAHAISVNFPTPWDGSPGVIFKGCPDCPNLDTGAVRIVNNTGGTLTVNAVIVRLDTCTFNLWSSPIALPLGGEFIVTQTANSGDGGCTTNGQFDASDSGSRGVDRTGVCTNSNIIPEIDVTVNGVTTTFADTGQVFNTGGIDAAPCPNGLNKSTQWTPIGNPPCPRAVLTLTPSTQSCEVGTTATVSATLMNSCGNPLEGVNVDFTSLAGPNVGTTHIDTTDRSGNASFSYTSASSGTDTLQVAVTNLAGTFTAPDVSVTWTNASSTAAAPASGGGGCSFRPGGAGTLAAYLAVLGNIGLPIVVLLVLRICSWRRQR